MSGGLWSFKLAGTKLTTAYALLAQKPILLNANHLFVLHKMFVTGTICK
jgi:hypothetical protein